MPLALPDSSCEIVRTIRYVFHALHLIENAIEEHMPKAVRQCW